MKKSGVALSLIALLALAPAAFSQGPARGSGPGGGSSLDAAEEVHLLFMRAEEKLAHDVYLALGAEFPDYAVFTNIVDSELNHEISMLDKIEHFGLTDPNINDGPGEFNAENYGAYFTDKYNGLADVAAAENPLLQALKNGALIEELDMHDIVLCPTVVVETVDDISDAYGCGMDYTDEKPLISSYENLLDGSENHLRAFVRVIESNFPEEYPYQAQYLSQEEVDEILGR
jgi:hypothetical protein